VLTGADGELEARMHTGNLGEILIVIIEFAPFRHLAGIARSVAVRVIT
jgi:hypothetical protein